MFNTSLTIKNYKCFQDEIGFDCIKRVNLIIGRNNSGKSSLLDLIEYTSLPKKDIDSSTWRKGIRPEIKFTSVITSSLVDAIFSASTSGGIIGQNHNTYGQQFIDKKITFSLMNGDRNYIDIEENLALPPLINTGYQKNLCNSIETPFEKKFFRRVLAERDITPETNSNTILVESNGKGITTAIQSFINKSKLRSELIEVDMLDALNEIFSNDAVFTDIVCQLHDTNLWEIYLEEKNKGRIALSKSGSGLKTVITVLVSLFIVPEIEKKPLSNYTFGFEELENNIHPSLLRKLNDYIYNLSIEHDFIYFLTTHSNVLIDQVSKQDDAQILHVTQSDGKSNCNVAKTYIANNGILDDLDIRASDLLQSNGIIWVEGPSDRIYLNKWISLWSDNTLKEGTHYQIIFYGGRLVSHLSGLTPDDESDGIFILSANRNSFIMMDSDKKTKVSRLKPSVKRIKEEFEQLKLPYWITKGKEIENYISSDVVNEFLNISSSSQVDSYDSFFDYLDTLKTGREKVFC